MALTRRQFGVLLGTAAATRLVRSVPRATASPAATAATPDAAQVWAELVQGNQRFVRGESRARPSEAMRRTLANGQHPRAVVLGCADSRVSPELVFDQNVGDIFVVRTAGNIA